ncbi:hypothetical protein B0H19DRAFT_1263483 [Mycena capillaripes]|nr:hypothetical protein B0H19DRAFT_1263483 [Mycena capillaripes]
MRAHFLSLLLVLCTLLASQAAPIDSRVAPVDSRELSSRKAKAAPKPAKAAPKAAAKPAKAAPKAAPKPAPKPVKAAPKPVPVKAAPKPVPVKAAPKPVPVKAAPKPVPVKAAPKPVPKPAKAAPKPLPVKAAPKPVPVKAVPKPVKAQPAAPPKTSKVATGVACPVRKKGSKAGVKAREGSDTEECEGASAADLCASLDEEGCPTCVGAAGLNCAFDVKGGKCVPNTTTGLTLAKNKQECVTLLAAEQSAAPPAVNVEVTKAAQKAFSLSVQDHIFKGNSNKKNSGRHMLTVWTKDNPTSAENKRDKATGVVEFQNGKGIKDIKTVWNDKDTGDGTFVYTEDQIKALCLRGYEQSILVNPSNQATLKAPATQTAASTSKKGKGKLPPPPAALKILSGLENGLVVHNQFINKNVCLNINSESCFPLGTGTASGKEGSPCTGDDGVAD